MTLILNSENPLKEAGLQFVAALSMVFGFIGLYWVKHETPFLNFLPEDPVVLLIGIMVVGEVLAISLLAYDQL